MTEGQVANGDSGAGVSELDSKIIRQVEYYFGDYNLPRDKFLQEQVKLDDGWITLETMTKFKRLASLSMDHEVIAAALKKSTSNLLEIHESNSKLRRAPNKPLPIFDDTVKEETMKRTVYCKGFPKDGSVVLDDMLEYFKAYGPYETVLMRYFFDQNKKIQGFKGSILVVFPTEEKAQEFMGLDEVKYQDTALIRKWHTDYVEEKRKEIEERRSKRDARRAENQENNDDEEETEMPKGTFVQFSGIGEGNDVTREDIKAALGDHAEQCAWIDFSRGQTEGYLRLKVADSNKVLLDTLEGKLKIKEHEVALRVVEGEEEDEQFKKMKEARNRNKKRKTGGRGFGRGFPNKRRRM